VTGAGEWDRFPPLEGRGQGGVGERRETAC
jgi:hypothetical protein